MEVKGGDGTKRKIDIDKLMDEAKYSCCRESYLILEYNHVYRIGVGAIIDDNGDYSFFLDINADLCSGGSLFRTVHLERVLGLVKGLKQMNYELVCGEGQITAQKFMIRNELNDEYLKIIQMVKELKIADTPED